MEENDVIIKCGNRSLNDAILSYLEECDLDFINYCKGKDIRLRYFDVDYETNTIVID